MFLSHFPKWNFTRSFAQPCDMVSAGVGHASASMLMTYGKTSPKFPNKSYWFGRGFSEIP